MAAESSKPPIEVASLSQARTESLYGYEGSFKVPDGFIFNALINSMGYAFSFNNLRDYVPRGRPSDYVHPSPGLGKLRELTVMLEELAQAEGKPELAISVRGLLTVSGRGLVAKIHSNLAIHRVKSTVPNEFYKSEYYSLQSKVRGYSEVYDDAALDPQTYADAPIGEKLYGASIESLHSAHDSRMPPFDDLDGESDIN